MTCEAGTFEASANVNVLDVPLKPRSLVPDEVRAEHVKLSWQPPADDGGTPITNYIVVLDLYFYVHSYFSELAERTSDSCFGTPRAKKSSMP